MVATLFIFTGAAPAFGAIYGTPAPLIGSRSVGSGLATINPNWSSAAIAWSIANNGDGTYTYIYTLTDFGVDQGGGESNSGLSHFTVDLSDDAIGGNGVLADLDAITDAMLDGMMLAGNQIDFGDIDGIVGAVKFDVGSDLINLEYSFTSNRSPVYGDIYAKDGKNGDMTNTGYGNPVSNNPLDFIARPNGAAPEPATVVLLSLGGAILLSRRGSAPAISHREFSCPSGL